MISIIICSANPTLLDQIKENIAETIGCGYELIVIKNANEFDGLCGSYNYGISLSIGEILCFCHEDIIFHTKDWGKKVAEIFEYDKKVKLLGVAGSTYKSFSPSGWDIDWELFRINLIQGYKFSNSISKHIYNNPDNSKYSKVACLDGLWFCTTKEIAETTKFDNLLFHNFHCYDIDFSLSVLKAGWELVVTYEILIEHFSEGKYSNSWIEDTLKLHEKWRPFLPIDLENISNYKKQQIEEKSLRRFLYSMFIFKYSLFKRINLIYLKNVNFKYNIIIKISIFKAIIKDHIRATLLLFKLLKTSD